LALQTQGKLKEKQRICPCGIETICCAMLWNSTPEVLSNLDASINIGMTQNIEKHRPKIIDDRRISMDSA